jgi:predicted metal-dependent phosphoesterase TrpH
MPKCFDLHSHSTCSDGYLSPRQLLQRAAERGVTHIALTDHDTVEGLPEATAAAAEFGLRLISGVEISASWRGVPIHVLGLGVDPHAPRLCELLRGLRMGRGRRAQAIALALAAAGAPDALEGALRYAGRLESIGRAHFARHLVESGRAKNLRAVFRRWLVPGKPGYVPHQWAALTDVVAAVDAAGGVAVLAHPGRYAIGKMKQLQLLGDFRDCGGRGIEVVASNHSREQTVLFTDLAQRFNFYASRGSDFHSPQATYAELGAGPRLPEHLEPVWQLL